MTVRTTTATQLAEHRVGPRARSLRENVQIETPQVDWRAPRMASTSTEPTVVLDLDIDLDDQAAVRDASARADNQHRLASLIGRSDLVRNELAAAWSQLG